MRTMLISLALIASLAQIIIAQGTPTEININDRKCGTVYKCYAPKQCTDSTVTTVHNEDLVEVLPVAPAKDVTINDNCPALIRFHSYTKNKAHVVIESFQKKEDVHSIEYLHTDNTGIEKNKFTCKIDNNKMRGLYYTFTKYIKDTMPDKLYCEFDAKRNPMPPGITTTEIFDGDLNDNSYISINANQKSKATNIAPPNKAYCDNDQFKFYPESNPKKLFQQTHSKPGKISCENPIYELEVKLDQLDSDYIPIKEEDITCVNGLFVIKEKTFLTTDPIYIRCFTKVEYLCKDVLKWSGQQKQPEQITPISESKNVLAELKCPSTDPHFIIVGDSGKGIKKQIPNATFECISYGDDPVWVVEGGEILTKEGPIVHCTNELQCDHMGFTIAESSVDLGYVNSNRIPVCHDQGTLKVNNKPVNVSCDLKSGKYKYKIVGEDGGGGTVDATTKFKCDYPVIEDKEGDKIKQDKIKYGFYAAGGVGIVAFVASVVICFYCVRRDIKKQERDDKKAEVEAKKDFYKYCADDDEIAEQKMKEWKQKKANIKEEVMSKREGKTNWNDQATHTIAVGMSLSKHENPNGHIASTFAKKSTMSTKEGMGGPFMTKMRKLEKTKEKRKPRERGPHFKEHHEYMKKWRNRRKDQTLLRMTMKYKTDVEYRNIPMNTPKKG